MEEHGCGMLRNRAQWSIFRPENKIDRRCERIAQCRAS
jgi:hypothetical protein